MQVAEYSVRKTKEEKILVLWEFGWRN